ncbi:MAG TPA: M48 family metallopeptidase [Pseudolabrys sp.]|nr:M48 family metallopeptidase [Pseudolabrys sp.]
MSSAAGIYFDGITSVRRDVIVELSAAGLQISDRDGRSRAQWSYDEIEGLDAPDNILRLGRRGSAALERLEIRDSAFAAEIDARSANVDRSGAAQQRQSMRVIGWSVVATASLVLFAWFGVPAIAKRLTPLLPVSIENMLGDAVNAQVRAMLDIRKAGAAFDCGIAAAEIPGRAALDKLVKRLEAVAALPLHLRTNVVRRDEANAMALPGGQVYVFQGLIAKADNPDEVAGVIAHEIGHVAHRDGTKAVLEGGGLSFLFGMLLGDFVGGGAVVLAAKSILQSSYSREAETAADAYGADLMNKAGGDARALATMLDKIGGATEPGMKILMDHPDTKARVAAINKLASAPPASPFLDASEWAALRKICAGS